MKTRIALALTALFALAPVAHAALAVYEGFDMGATPGPLAGKAGATSVGFDAAGWAALSGGTPGNYETTGLTFGSGATALAVTGGRARLDSVFFGGAADNDIMSRGLNVTITGTVWGSYLGQRVANSTSQQDAMHAMINQSASGNDNNSEFVISMEEFDSSSDGVDVGGQRGKNTPIFPSYNAGVEVSTNLTYMVLFKATNLGGSSGNADIKEWILTSAQFDNFKPGGLTEAELDAAATGIGPTQVQQRGSQSYDPNAAPSRPYPRLTNADFYLMQTFRGLNGQYDELRLSDALTTIGLDEVTPLSAVPEPSSLFLLTAGTSLGLAAAGLRRSHRRQHKS